VKPAPFQTRPRVDVRARNQAGRLVAGALLLSCSGKTLEVGTNPPPSSTTQPKVIVQGLLEPPATLISDGTSLFWLDFTASGLWTVEVGGGTPRKLADNAYGSELLYADADQVYYLAADGIDAVPKTGGPPKRTIAVTRASPATVVGSVAYWVEEDASSGPADPETVSLRSARLQGGPATTLAALPRTSSYDAIAVTPTSVVLAAFAGLTTVPIDGGNPRAVSSTLACQDLLGTTDGVYCAESPALGNPPLLLLTSSGRTAVIAADTANARSLAVDRSRVYWANDATHGGGVVSAPRGGGELTWITKGAGCVAVAVDDASVYWSEEAGTIKRVPK
jgi:hypothetical protein